MKTSVIEVLKERGLVEQLSDQDMEKLMQKPMKFYIGFDPTAKSLHLGNLVGIVVACWLRRYGHIPHIMTGGATGKIGDPSGKSEERPFLEEQVIDEHVKKIQTFFRHLFSRIEHGPKPVFIDNNDWLSEISLLPFLRDSAKNFRIGQMLAKESVKARLESPEGLSLTEFFYQVLQAYDFFHLFSNQQVCLQVGGSDQWGNITAGIELIRKSLGKSAYGFTFPLLLKSDGTKFGKSEKGAVWLSEEMLSSYDFYQYLYRVSDSDVIRLLKMLTFLDMAEIVELEKQMKSSDYVPNTAQKILAEEVTRFVRGEDGLQLALKVTQTALPGKKMVLDAENIKTVMGDLPTCRLSFDEVVGTKITDLFYLSKATASKSEALRLIKNGGAYLNNERISDPEYRIDKKDCIDSVFLVLGVGRKRKILISIQ